MKRLLLLLLTIGLLTGCTTGLQRYPWVEPTAEKTYNETLVRLHLPSGADDTLTGSMLLLEAKLQDLTGGKVTLSTGYEDSVLEAYREGKAGLYLLTNSELEALDERMRFARMPFLFADRGQLFAFLNSSTGPVRSSSVTAQQLQGQIIGTYYRDTMWMMGRSAYYDEIGFFNSVGVLSGLPGSSCFGVLGSETVLEGSQTELLAALAEGTVKYCEMRPFTVLDDATFEKIKGLEITEHRYEGWWLVLKNPQELPAEVLQLVQESFAYTIEQQNTTAIADYDSYVQEMRGVYTQAGQSSGYSRMWLAARRYYRDNWELLGIPADIWRALSGII